MKGVGVELICLQVECSVLYIYIYIYIYMNVRICLIYSRCDKRAGEWNNYSTKEVSVQQTKWLFNKWSKCSTNKLTVQQSKWVLSKWSHCSTDEVTDQQACVRNTICSRMQVALASEGKVGTRTAGCEPPLSVTHNALKPHGLGWHGA